jgi:hypothetical protein
MRLMSFLLIELGKYYVLTGSRARNSLVTLGQTWPSNTALRIALGEVSQENEVRIYRIQHPTMKRSKISGFGAARESKARVRRMLDMD